MSGTPTGWNPKARVTSAGGRTRCPKSCKTNGKEHPWWGAMCTPVVIHASEAEHLQKLSSFRDDCIDGLFAFLLHVLKILRTIKSGLLRWEDGKIKVKFSVQVITRTMIIKRGSHRIPWLLHRTKMSKQCGGESR